MFEVRAEFLLKIGGIIYLLIPCRAFVVSFLNKLHESCLQKKKSVTGNFGYLKDCGEPQICISFAQQKLLDDV